MAKGVTRFFETKNRTRSQENPIVEKFPGAVRFPAALPRNLPELEEKCRIIMPMTCEQKIIRFPHRRSVGTLYVAALSQPEEWELLSQVRGLVVTPENQPIKWEWLEEARGNVTIPEGQKLKLKIGGKGSGSLAPLADLHADDLHTLDLSRSEISDISLSHLQKLTGLKVLELTATNITDEGLRYLQPLVNLQGLGLSHCQISGRGIAHLSNLCDLRELWMSGAEVEDNDLVLLERMVKLVQLGLSGTQITDEGLHKLAKLQALMRIYLFNTQVSQQGTEGLRQKLSGCRVKWKPAARVDESLLDVDPSTPLEQLLAGLPPEVRSAFALPLEGGTTRSESLAARSMNDDVFWQVIEALDWEKTGDDDAVLEPAIRMLAGRKDQDILDFADILSEKLHLLDGQAFAKEIGQDAYEGPRLHFSRNCFLSARCCAIANGQEFYNQVLEDPAQMPKDMEFEALINVPSKAYERKTGRKLTYITKYSYETFANKSGWPESCA